MMRLITIGECPVCRQGTLVIAKERSSGNLLVICDDCESQWLEPLAVIEGQEPLIEEKHNLEDATSLDIEARGWNKYFK